MPTNKKESLIYTFFMCFFMVYFMSFYNISLQIGFGVDALALAWNDLPLAILTAFILDWFIVATPAKNFAFKFIDETDSMYKKIFIISFFMICGMVVFMSFYGAVIHTGFTSALLGAWLNNIMLNFIVALPLQLLIAGPIVRRVFRYLFPMGTISIVE